MDTDSKDPIERRQAAAYRAKREAADRRATQQQEKAPVERGGRDGPEPTRYGDWEKEGIISDF